MAAATLHALQRASLRLLAMRGVVAAAQEQQLTSALSAFALEAAALNAP